ncbi:MAG: hypothetical protein ACREQ2_23500 [Candidatus Binatia bacterium]
MPDCIASEDAERDRQVLMLMQRVFKAEIPPSNEIKFEGTRVASRGAADYFTRSRER